MYRAYAQDAEMRINLGIRRRLAPLLGGDRRKIEMGPISFLVLKHVTDQVVDVQALHDQDDDVVIFVVQSGE